MSTYALHMAGDCWPDNCPVCAQECDGCGDLNGTCGCDDDAEDEP